MKKYHIYVIFVESWVIIMKSVVMVFGRRRTCSAGHRCWKNGGCYHFAQTEVRCLLEVEAVAGEGVIAD